MRSLSVRNALVDRLPAAPHHGGELLKVIEQFEVFKELPIRLVLLY